MIEVPMISDESYILSICDRVLQRNLSFNTSTSRDSSVDEFSVEKNYLAQNQNSDIDKSQLLSVKKYNTNSGVFQEIHNKKVSILSGCISTYDPQYTNDINQDPMMNIDDMETQNIYESVYQQEVHQQHQKY